MKKKILILGSDSQLAKCLKDNKTNKYNYLFFNKKELDVTNIKKIKLLVNKINPYVIINCTAFTEVDNAENNIKLANSINYIAIKNIIDSIKNKKILFVHFSTDYVFDGLKKISYTEKDKTNPISVYGKTKLKGEQILIKENKFYLIFRISWLYSKYKKNLLTNFYYLSKNNKNLNIVADNIGRPTNANEFSKFLYIAIDKTLKNNSLSGLYNYSDSGISSSWYDLVNFIYSQMKFKGLEVPILYKIKQESFKSKAKRPINSSFNLKKTSNAFNYKIKNWKINLKSEIKNFIKL
tara:strand:+ start:1755 stop:2636 length:882 start_codon:yes stop_codon:yes gene_type:complete